MQCKCTPIDCFGMNLSLNLDSLNLNSRSSTAWYCLFKLYLLALYSIFFVFCKNKTVYSINLYCVRFIVLDMVVGIFFLSIMNSRILYMYIF